MATNPQRLRALRAELHELALARGDAQRFAEDGNPEGGLVLLRSGLNRVLRLPEDSPDRQDLVGRWRTAVELFAEIHRLRLEDDYGRR